MAMVEFVRPDGGKTGGWLSMAGRAAGHRGDPGMVGLNDQIRASLIARARRHNALAPDLYGPRDAEARRGQPPDDRPRLPGATHQTSPARSTICAVSGKVGDGYCMGGALTVASAVHVPNVAAAVCFYGIPPAEFADPAKIKIPFQGHFANKDDWCTPAAADALEKAMQGAGQKPEIHRYDANHGFCNERSEMNYHVASANTAWDRMMAFLGKM